MTKSSILSLSAGTALLLLGNMQPAMAFHGRFLSVQGWRGGFVAGRTVNRAPGSTTVHRGVQTDSGHGFATTRQTNYGDASRSNTVTRTYDNGETATRTGTATRNPDGSVTREATHTGVDGNTQTGWSTIYKGDDSVSRSRGITTSTGKSVTETGSVTYGDGSAMVNRTITTGSGASVSGSQTFTRGN
jgi:hypothetical protein